MHDVLKPHTRMPDDVLRIVHRVVDEAVDVAAACASLEAAVRLGATFAEADCRQTADGVLVSRHAPRGRAAGAWLVEAEAAAVPDELRLEDVMAGVAAVGLGLYLDVKALDARGRPELERLLDGHPDLPCVLASHRGEVLLGLQGLDRPLSILYYSVDEDPAEVAASCRAQFVHPCWERLDDPAAVLADGHLRRAREAGLGVVTWHEERPAQLTALLRLGVDGICTDDAALLLTAVGELRGA